MSGVLTVGPVTRFVREGDPGVVAAVDGEALWFTSADAPLGTGAEAIAGCVLAAAAAGHRRLGISDRVSATWLLGLDRLQRAFHRWWGWPILAPQAAARTAAEARAPGKALCFTGGVDSFFSLLCGPAKPDLLAYVVGYDIPLGDGPRRAAFEPSFRYVAAAAGARSVVIRSNLRQHHLMTTLPWERAHGGALAAVGHLLSGEAGTLLISSSFPPRYGIKWGSHASLDRWWSSDRVGMVHFGATHSRVGKVREIARHETARRHLRVCWENRAATGNCSRCDKCVSTMVLLASVASGDECPTFDWSGAPLAERIDLLPRTRFANTYREFLAGRPDPRLARAIRALLLRTALWNVVTVRAGPILDRVRLLPGLHRRPPC